ncbi:MAG: shikimate dehydrogenase [Actinomycetota bacterium]|nr:shikimate dehydrogenase [Actinomycetota bacterium]
MTLTGATRLVGLIGKPVAESLSPRMQNAAFAARGLDWAYVAMEVEPEGLEAAVRGLVAEGFAGANVTVPHKEAVVGLCDEADGDSVNTLVIRDGRVLGTSTDGIAVAGAIDATGAHVLLLGAGGAARAVARALLLSGAASVCVASRNLNRAAALVEALGDERAAASPRWPPETRAGSVIVNATPVRDDPLVRVSSEHVVVDLAYRGDGGKTTLVAVAEQAACNTIIDGLEVLVRQGAASFELWTGVPAPVDVMRAAVRSAA